MSLLTFGDSSPAAGRDFTDDGQVHEHRGLKGRPRKAIRRVPIPPQLAALLREHMERFGTARTAGSVAASTVPGYSLPPTGTSGGRSERCR